MSLSDVVNVQIAIQSSALSLPGFGIPLVLGPVHSNFPERLRYYSSADAMLDDGFVATDAAYLEVQAALSQNPRPLRVAVGRRTATVAQVETMRIIDQGAGDYAVTVNGQTATYTAGALDTATDIRDALVTAINGLSTPFGETGVTAAPSGNEDLTLTADTAGIQFSVAVDAGTITGGLVFVQTLDFSGAGADGNYTVNIGTTPFTVQALGNTATEIRDAMVPLIDAATGTTGVDAISAATDALDLASSTNFVTTVSSPGSAVTLAGRTLNHGLLEDLAAISDFQDDWYVVLLTDRADAPIFSTAKYIETTRKLLVAQTSDASNLNDPYDAVSPLNIGSKLRAGGYARTSVWYSSVDTRRLATAIAAKQSAKTPGSSNWAHQTLAGVEPDAFTTTQLANMESNYVNGFRVLAGRNVTFYGWVAAGEFVDIIRGVDKLYQTIQANSFVALLRNEKIDMTDQGIAVLAATVIAAIEESVTEGLIAISRTNPITGDVETPAYTVTPPRVADIPAASRASREIPASRPIAFEGTLAGAINNLAVNGTLSV